MMPNLNQCLAMQDRARSVIPGMTQLLSKRPDMFAPGYWPGYYRKAKGAEIWDLDGNRYIDMSIGGIGANVLGYADPDVNAAVVAAIQNGSSSSLNCPEEVELSDLLCELHPWAAKVRYARSGGESMAIAVRIARASTGRDIVAFCGYHGWHDWYLAANLEVDDALDSHLLSGLSPAGVPRGLAGTAFPFRYNHIEELEQIVASHGQNLAAIVMEPIRSSPPRDGFLNQVLAIAQRTGAVLIVDEISAGFRLATGGAHLVLGLEPDIAVFSKALGNGFPIAAVLGKAAVMDAAQDTFISSTMFTERVGPAAALATIHKFRQHNVSERLVALGENVMEGWRMAADQSGIAIQTGGIAPLAHFAFDCEDAQTMKALFVKLMLQKGFLASTLFYAMYAHQDKHVRDYLRAARQAFAHIAAAQTDGALATALDGLPATTGFQRLT